MESTHKLSNDPPGALILWAAEGDISGIQVSDLLIENPTFSGIKLHGNYSITSASFDHIEIKHAGLNGIYVTPDAQGLAFFSFVSIFNSTEQNILNSAPASKFILTQGNGNIGWP